MPMRSLWAIVAPVFLASVYLATAPAVPHAQETTENPFTTVLDVRMGERLFRQQCGRCHGRDAKGGELGPDLTSGLQNTSTDAGLFKVVREGLPNTQMIGISRSATDQSVWMVVSYVNSLNDHSRRGPARQRHRRDAAVQRQGQLRQLSHGER